MIAGVKKCIDTGDIKGLRYIFLDSLDVDPTFGKYRDDYAVCKKIEGMFEPYKELTALSINRSEWNKDYWVKLKYDQKQNFSEERFEHMIEVAKVVNAEKVERLLAERTAKKTIQPIQNNPITRNVQARNSNTKNSGSITESEKARIRKRQNEIELHNQRVEQEIREAEQRRARSAKEVEKQNALVDSLNQSKKATGIGAVLVIAIVIAVIVLLLKVL